MPPLPSCHSLFFTETTAAAIYTLSLHDALPISSRSWAAANPGSASAPHIKPSRIQLLVMTPDLPLPRDRNQRDLSSDRKSTRLNSSHSQISYAVFCLKKKTNA